MTTRHPAGHLLDSQSYWSGDHSRDNLVLGILALGEDWHNSQHAFPTLARHGLGWRQVDVSYYVICLFTQVGLAWKVRLPSRESRARAGVIAKAAALGRTDVSRHSG